MKKQKDATLKWIDDEIRRVKNQAVRDSYTIAGKRGNNMDPVSQKQIDALEKQKEQYLKSLT